MNKLKAAAAIAAMGGAMLASAALAADQVDLKWQMWTSTQAEIDAWQHLADMVTEKYPDINVTLQTSPFADYFTKLPVLAASGQLPDIVSMQSLRMPNFYSIMQPLDDMIAKDKFDIDAYVPSIVGGMSAGGKVYGLAYDVGPWVIYYNQDMFDAAGLKTPEIGWTVDDFTKAAKALTKDGKYGFAVDPTNYAIMAAGMGDHYLDKDGKLDLTNPEAVAAAKTMIDFVAKDKIAPVMASSNNTGDIIRGNFTSGNVAMYITGPWSMINLRQKVKFKIGIATMPSRDGQVHAVTAGSGFGIAASSQHKAEAWKAIQVLTSPEALDYLAKLGRALPARTAEQHYWYEIGGKDVTDATKVLTYSMQHSDVYAITDNWNAVSNLMTQYFPPAFTGNASAQKTMETIQSLASH